jgi:hypothetical protein
LESQYRRTRKKLIGAARHWAGVREAPQHIASVDANVLAGLKAMGAPAAVIAAAEAQQPAVSPDAEVFQVWLDNWPVWMLFLQVQRQWVYAGMSGQRVSLNYPGIETHFRLAPVPRGERSAFWADLQIVENAVLMADYEQQQKRN